MKQPSNDLFELIKSLTQAEKGYFRRHALIDTKGPDTKYNLLFNAINEMENYDEQEITRQFKREKFTNRFAVAKAYLYERILFALHSFHESAGEEIRRNLHYAEILFEKGQFAQAHKIIRKTKNTALSGNQYFYLPAILHMEHKLAVENYDLDWIAKISEEEKYYATGLQNISTYSALSNTIGICLLKKDVPSEKEREKKIAKTIKHPLLQDEKKATTFSSLLYYYDAHCFYHLYKGNPHRAKEFVKKRLVLYQKYPEKFRHYFHSYLSCMNNLLHLCHETQSYNELEKYLWQLSSTPPTKKINADKVFYFYVYTGHFLRYAHQTGQYAKALQAMQDINKGYLHNERFLNPLQKTVICMHTALVWFAAGEYNKCLKYLNKIRNEFSLGTHPHIERFLHIFYLIVHYERKHDDLLPYLTKSFYRYLCKQSNPKKFEQILLDFLKNKLPKAINHKKRIEIFNQLKQQLLPLSKNQNEKQAFEFFDYISWLESKIENRPFMEIMQEKRISLEANK